MLVFQSSFFFVFDIIISSYHHGGYKVHCKQLSYLWRKESNLSMLICSGWEISMSQPGAFFCHFSKFFAPGLFFCVQNFVWEAGTICISARANSPWCSHLFPSPDAFNGNQFYPQIKPQELILFIVWKEVSCPSCFLYTFYPAASMLQTLRSTLRYIFAYYERITRCSCSCHAIAPGRKHTRNS